MRRTNPDGLMPPHDTGYFLALTFGTLLSSQESGAHRSRPFSRSRGNSPNLAFGRWGCQTCVVQRQPTNIPGVGHGVAVTLPSTGGPRTVLQRFDPLVSGASGAVMKLGDPAGPSQIRAPVGAPDVAPRTSGRLGAPPPEQGSAREGPDRSGRSPAYEGFTAPRTPSAVSVALDDDHGALATT